MKILYVAAALPHYFNLVINKLNQVPSIEIVVVVPDSLSSSVGAGVYQEKGEINFRVIELRERKRYWTKSFFDGFVEVLEQEQPAVILMGWPYILAWLFDKKVASAIKKQGIKVIYKDIPFNIPPYHQAHRYYVTGQIKQENLSAHQTFSLFDYLKYRLLTYCRKLYLHKADAHIYYTPAAINLMATYGVPARKIFVTANSPDTDLLLATFKKVQTMPFIMPYNPYRIIHVGRLVKWKRVDLLIDAVHLLKNKYPQIELLVLGYGQEEQNLQQQVIKLGLQDSIRFIGGVYEPLLLGQYLHASSVYVLAGMGGLSINDAMCFAKPIVCSVADGTEAQLVRENENGYYFEEGNAHSLANKIDTLLSDTTRVQAFGKRSLQIIEQEINIHTVIAQYLQAFYAVTQSTSTS